ncbi:DUF1295-domain-containing protein [Basidiobolus meristosporus CBS 931.73]|uniref:DUF1295-domain-containing protein n=1 Tax=Basidiobolus meristosporus CBS 931.73 TaxID=1314790 RepID=A0A1Y1YE43_9FUNG|nr:DUF1295-domain-containing protein [Basidiobolus meristosporus CBS 931.73]|eukprot:ORX96215.1 DUF1295-domain-containing protein [Basidiobolus meristosporus CBS 931.73]
MAVVASVLKATGITSGAIQLVSFLIAAPLQTEKFFDLSGCLTFVSCVFTSIWKAQGHLDLGSLHPRQLLATATTLTWSLKLGSFLFVRILKDGSDKRMGDIKKKPIRFAITWTMQAVWVFLTALPVYMINGVPYEYQPSISWLDYLGLGIWGVGMLTETIADYQKFTWRLQKENKEKFIKHGLWSLSRHPNYLGEILLWSGSWIMCGGNLLSIAANHPQILSRNTALLSLLSPLFVTGLLTKVSGIPLLEKSSDKKFGHMKEYREYKSRTPVLIPRFSN